MILALDTRPRRLKTDAGREPEGREGREKVPHARLSESGKRKFISKKQFWTIKN